MSWMSRGSCRGLDTGIFFPELGQNATEAREICGACPVKISCMQYAVVNNLKDGVWGGTTPTERRVLRRKYLQSIKGT